MNKERVAVFIDGGNFHHLVLKKIGITEIDFDFEKFITFLLNGRLGPSNCKRYYIGTVREKEGDQNSKNAMAKQTRFFSVLKKYSWNVRTSKLKTRNEIIIVDERMDRYEELRKIGIKEIKYERKREKGIDVMIATDLIVGAVEDMYDTAIIISSDADLLPAIQWVRSKKEKKIEYIGFSILDEKNPTKPLQSMISNTDIQRVLIKEDLNKMIINKKFVGVLIEESLENKDIIKKVNIISTEVEIVTEGHKTPWVSQWTMHTVEILENQVKKISEEISHALDSKHNWYADFKSEAYHYIIFRNKIFYIDRKNKEQYEEAKKYGISLGIPEYQVDFHPDTAEWKR